MRKISIFSFLCLFLGVLSQRRHFRVWFNDAYNVRKTAMVLLIFRVLAQGHASTPPRGWNSYDSFCWTISEEEYLQSAQVIAQKLRPHGYEYAVVDYLWYRKKVPGAYVDSYGFDVIDEWGRPIPEPGRWPSSAGGKEFSEVVEKVHKMGLKFGIHLMRGISTQVVDANTPIFDTTKETAYEEGGRKWTAKDIGITERHCAWMTHGFMSVNISLGAGKAFLRSLYQQYADWGVDFVKNDCVFGEDIDIGEITVVSEFLKQLDRPVLYSLSRGTRATSALAKDLTGLVNMYRVTGDDWDTWGDVLSHFDVTRRQTNKAHFRGAKNSAPTIRSLYTFQVLRVKGNVKNDDLDGTWQSRRQLKSVNTLDSQVFGLTSCADEQAIGWSTKALDQDLEHICWKENWRKKHRAPFCLNKIVSFGIKRRRYNAETAIPGEGQFISY